jgi:uncharacterized membrane protein YidH (DUF202 family)
MDIAPAKDEDKRTGLTGKEVAEAIAFREMMLKEKLASENGKGNGQKKKHVPDEGDGEVEDEDVDDVDARTAFLRRRKSSVAAHEVNGIGPRAMSINPLAPSSAFDETLRDKLRGAHDLRPQALSAVDSAVEEGHDHDDDGLPADDSENLMEEGSSSGVRRGGESEFVRFWKAPVGKRIAVPVRIEPKVYFAAERTFLKWLNTAIFIAGIATTLLNFTPPEDSRGLISSAIFTLTALLAIAYSAIIFVFRAYRLRARRAEGLYYDRYGPTVLCVVLLAALGTNIGLRVSEMIDTE